MSRTYLIGHWVLTLLLAPFTSQIIEYIVGKSPHQIVGLLEVYPITLLFGIIFSLPTFLIYLTSFYYLSKHNLNFAISKLILIAISVLGVFITQTIIKGSMSKDIIISYSITTIIVGLMLKLKSNKRIQEKRITT